MIQSSNTNKKGHDYIVSHINPVLLKDFVIHKNIAKNLLNFNDSNINHTLFYGQSNSGKRTLINAFLKNMFNDNIKTTKFFKDISYNNTKVSIEYMASQYHYELNLCEYGFSDKFIITEFIQKILSYKNITDGHLKIIVLYNIDKINIEAQYALRKILEKYSKNGRFIFSTNNINSVDKAILSRCVYIRVPKPKKEYIREYIKKLCININKSVINAIISKTDNNLSKINEIIYLYNTTEFDINSVLKSLDNKHIVKEIYNLILVKNLDSMLQIREIIFKLLLINITPDFILNELRILFIKNLDQSTNILVNQIFADNDIYMTSINYRIMALEMIILEIKKLLINKNF
tara:strand:+ start:2008 stop:3048 length:1041 start_codon:yes stop_codon:yes gene_type:complete